MKNTFLIILTALTSTVNFSQNLNVVTDVNDDLEEVSALEHTAQSNFFWVIEDSGNDNILYAIDSRGQIQRKIEITNVKNDDWEDLTSDAAGNLYIGDFGNNSEKRKTFNIYKVKSSDLSSERAEAECISFSLPRGTDSRDFESFFLWKDSFYVFSKEKKDPIIITIPNLIGQHTAKVIAEVNLKEKKNKITSADISHDGKMIALLNHDKIWLLTNFKPYDFSNLNLESIDFDHKSQKEGLYFKTSNMLFISDERDDDEGGKIYQFTLSK